MLNQTPLYQMHKKYQGKMIDFNGWELPVQYEGIIKEHHMVREKAGLFDVSHMGKIAVMGVQAQDFLQYLLSNDINNVSVNQVQYSLMCYPDGGVVDDLIIYKYSDDHFLLVINAANIDKDYAWIKQNAFAKIEIQDISRQYAQLAVQGPAAEKILQRLTQFDLDKIRFFWFNPEIEIAGIDCLLSRTGYTGEDGFEIYLESQQAPYLWEEILKTGGPNICPVGLGARDTLRFEAKLPLYGQEITKDITPLEAGLKNFVKLDKRDFIGKKALQEQYEKADYRMLVEFIMQGRGIPRTHYRIEKAGIKIGQVTSGGYSPTLKKNMGLAIIDREYAQTGEEIDIIIHNRSVKASIGENIFYKKKTKSTNK